ncbi:Rieske (2Fe-2S) protein [Geodermatophilus ruber]|uniref:Nitrite reductase (NADH) small subunit n=1 Tax=Geodermatophilus ruber TaxID=504800 RepID=A0A1I4GQG7_9ACTN|nr:Rieske 2Fe-2S domain-containing protein [Geodermatophilus ruber]SFL32274.1 nitrite reductase (NADH) small subunit [Geodermatophilus ruber]
MSEWVHVAELKELQRRRKKLVTAGDRPIALFLVDGEVYAIDDTCVHRERSLSKGTLLDGQVICPGHQWRFDPRTGHPEDQEGCLATYAVQVSEDGHVLVDPAPVSPRRETTPEAAAAAPAPNPAAR